MCNPWKWLGITALFSSLFYNLMLAAVIVNLVLRCHNECSSQVPGSKSINMIT